MALPSRVADLTGFDLLRSVARLGSIGQAARAHGISQPAASERIRQLEARVGTALVRRSPRGATLSPAGALIVDWATPVLDSAADLEVSIGTLRRERDSRLRVAASLTVAEYLMPLWLVGLRDLDPDTTVALTPGNSADVIEAVLASDADLGFIEGAHLPTSLDSATVAADELVVVVAPNHPWAARRRRVRPDELARTPLVSREEGSGTRQVLELALRPYAPDGLVAPALELSSTTAIKNAVMAGIGPAVLSSLAVAPELTTGTLQRIAVSDVDLTRSLRAVWPAGDTPRGPAADLAAIAAR